MTTLQAFGSTSNIWNLRPSEDGVTPADILITSIEGGIGRFVIPKYKATSISEGSFTFPVGATTAAQISGSFFKNEFYINNVLVQREIYLQGSDVSKIGNYQYELSLLSGDDLFMGSNLNSTDGDGIQGLAGNDRFKGFDDGQFGDSFFGGDGRDTSIYQGKASEYSIRFDNQIWDGRKNDGSRVSGFVVDDKVAARDGTDNLNAVERLEFEQTDSNGVNRIALDTGKDQTAGSGYMLYKAAFNRTPDVGGLGFWISKMDAGMSYSDVANNFVNSAEFKDAFGGSNPTVNTLVTKLYNNVLNRAPDAGGLAFWQEKLTTGWSTADVLGYFSTSAENVTNVTPLIANGIQYQQFVG